MKPITRKRLIKLITSRAFYDFILTEAEPLTTDEVCNWLMTVDNGAPKKIKNESEEIERIGGENGLIIENGLWIDIKIASLEARTKPKRKLNSSDNKTLALGYKEPCERDMKHGQMSWIF